MSVFESRERIDDEEILTLLRDRLTRTDPADARLRTMLVLAHEAVKQRRAAAALEASWLQDEPEAARAREPMSSEDYAELVQRVNGIATSVIPAGAATLVVSRGDDDLLGFAASARHFPQGSNGVYAGHYPHDSAAAIAHLRHCLDGDGTGFLVLPATSYWWLEYYGQFAQHLLSRGRVAHHDEHCLIFDLRQRSEGNTA